MEQDEKLKSHLKKGPDFYISLLEKHDLLDCVKATGHSSKKGYIREIFDENGYFILEMFIALSDSRDTFGECGPFDTFYPFVKKTFENHEIPFEFQTKVIFSTYDGEGYVEKANYSLYSNRPLPPHNELYPIRKKYIEDEPAYESHLNYIRYKDREIVYKTDMDILYLPDDFLDLLNGICKDVNSDERWIRLPSIDENGAIAFINPSKYQRFIDEGLIGTEMYFASLF